MFALPADTFTDTDANDTLSLAARLAGGGALPAWLTFDPTTGAFSGSPQVSSIGLLHLEVSATDAAGEATVDDFGLMVRAPDGATVSGRKGDDVIHGGSGDETLIAKGGSDYVYGDAGDDVLHNSGTVSTTTAGTISIFAGTDYNGGTPQARDTVRQ